MLNATRDAINTEILRQSLSADTFEALNKELQAGREAQKLALALEKRLNEAIAGEREAIADKNNAVADLAAVKKKLADLEGAKTEAAIEKAKADTIKECFGLVFRNLEVRRHTYGDMVVPGGGDMAGYIQQGTNSTVTQTA